MKVKIALSVGLDGDWVASGWHDDLERHGPELWNEFMDAHEVHQEQRFWVEIELPDYIATTLSGEVSFADE